jgi:dopamine beta-monooxygenase
MASALILLLALCHVTGFPHFQDAIPNGEFVPHPCKANYVWHGVGHENTLGSGVRNVFGKDFERAGKVM